MDPLRLVYLANPDINEAEAPVDFKGHSVELVHITTRSGRMLKVTPVHQLQQLRPDGAVVETPAGKLKPGDFLVAPRKIPLALKVQTVDPYKYLPERLRIRDDRTIELMAKIIERLKRTTTLKNLSRQLQTSYPALLNYYLKRARPTVGFLARLSRISKEEIPISRVEAERHGKGIRIPEEMSAELAEFLGLILSDGTIRAMGSVVLFNNDPKVLERFSKLSRQLFETEAKPGKHSGGRLMIIDSTALANFLVRLGVPPGKKSRTVRIPDIVCMSPDNVIASFLAGYIAGDGSFREFWLEIATASQEMALGLSYLLTRLGILHRARQRRIANHTYHRVNIEGKRPIAQLRRHLPRNLPYPFLERIETYLNDKKRGYNSIDTVPLDPSVYRKTIELSNLSIKKLEENRVWIRNYTDLNQRPGIDVLKRLVSLAKEQLDDDEKTPRLIRDLEHLLQLSEHTFFDEVVDTQRIQYSG